VRKLGDPNFAGISTPSPPSREYKAKFFIETIYLSPLKRKIMEIEREIEQPEEKVKRIPEHKRIKEKEYYRGVDYVAHPLIEKLENLREELKEERKRYEKIEKDWERYRQARREIHLIATLD
jgi:predicted RNase H-like nuclease (RuvC/YqgF family)